MPLVLRRQPPVALGVSALGPWSRRAVQPQGGMENAFSHQVGELGEGQGFRLPQPQDFPGVASYFYSGAQCIWLVWRWEARDGGLSSSTCSKASTILTSVLPAGQTPPGSQRRQHRGTAVEWTRRVRHLLEALECMVVADTGPSKCAEHGGGLTTPARGLSFTDPRARRGNR